MPDAVLVAIGVVAGLAVGWLLASSRARPGVVKQLAETKVRGARVVETMKQEVAVELARKDSELTDVRIETGATAPGSPRADAAPDTTAQPQPLESARAISEAVRTPVPPPRVPPKTGSALPTSQTTPGGSGRPRAKR